jgi:geranylgeranyl reductase family protein
MTYDVAVVGAGPAGATCAALCAQAGLSTLLLEKAVFPRDKVCGDCLNAACWPILDQLEVSPRIHKLAHSTPKEVEFISVDGRSLRFPLPQSAAAGISVSRRLLDAVLLDRARELGAVVREDTALTAIALGWQINTTRGDFSARTLIAADGRNSTAARLLGLLPAAAKDRIGLQAHIPAPANFGDRIALHFLPQGYGGLASIGDNLLNVCLVARPQHLPELKAWATTRFDLATDQPWRTITPLARRPVPPAHKNLLLVGDAARVVEPFTGEGIYYALASGALAASQIITGDLPGYAAAHRRLYRGRLWINELAKAAVLHPWLAAATLRVAQAFPSILHHLTHHVVAPPAPLTAPPMPTTAAQR